MWIVSRYQRYTENTDRASAVVPWRPTLDMCTVTCVDTRKVETGTANAREPNHIASVASAMASKKTGKSGKRKEVPEDDLKMQFHEMFSGLYNEFGAKRPARGFGGVPDQTVRQHKTFLKKNPELKAEFDAYCADQSEMLRAADRQRATTLCHLIKMDAAEDEFRARIMPSSTPTSIRSHATAIKARYTY